MTSNKLSILLQRDGLSFLVYKDQKSIANKYLPFDANKSWKENLIAAMDEDIYLKQAYSKVGISILTNKFVLVPKAYQQNNVKKENWLGFNAEVLENDEIVSNELPEHDAFILYAVSKDLIAFAQDQFNVESIVHAGKLFLTQINEFSEKDQLFVNFHQHAFELAVIKNKKLHLYNIYNYKTKEDVLYHILNVIKQLDINSNTVEMYYYGLFHDEDTLKMLMNFIRHVIPASTDLHRMKSLTLIENLA